MVFVTTAVLYSENHIKLHFTPKKNNWILAPRNTTTTLYLKNTPRALLFKTPSPAEWTDPVYIFSQGVKNHTGNMLTQNSKTEK